jgi:two-component system chemotaxis sensor kinase CheA
MSMMEERYLDDIKDLLASLENNLLIIEEDHSNTDLLEQIFRDLHTIKGAVLMFGMQDLGDFIHKIESIFDGIRSDEYVLTEGVVQNSLLSLDLIKEALNYENFDEYNLHERATKLIRNVESETIRKGGSSKAFKGSSIFLVIFKPKIDLNLKDGHPLQFIIDDLKENPHQEKINFKKKPGEFIKEYRLLFHSENNIEEIKSLFLFVEDDLELFVEGFGIEDKSILKESMDAYKSLLEVRSRPQLIKKLKSRFTYKEESKKVNKTSRSSQVKKNKESQKENSYIKVSRDKIDDLMGCVSELITMQATLKNEADKLGSQALLRVSENMELITEHVRQTIFSVSLIPISNLETRFKRLIRDLCSSLDKKVDLKTKGTDTELDKKIIDTLSDPLLHIIRNCLGHGIESPDERLKKGKSEKGTISLDSYYSGNHVVLEITDDGQGINTYKVKQKAIENGLIGKEDNLTEDEILSMIFHPGFSTAEEVNDVSGRGVGMDVVRKKIQEIRGEVLVSSEKDIGTKFTIKIPLSLSIIDGLLTKVGNTHFILPLNTVREIHRINKTEFSHLPTGSQILEIEGKQMPVISLEKSFSLPNSGNQTSDIITVDVGINKKGVAVDQIKGQIKAVLKPLSEYYEAQEFISGGTILGDGSLALILDMDQLIMKN